MSNIGNFYTGTDGADYIVFEDPFLPVRVDAKAGDDVVFGPAQAGAFIFGGAGSDILYGGQVDDTISGGAGNDQLVGGGGNDVFRFERGGGSDQISQKFGASARLELDSNLHDSDLDIFAENDNNLVIQVRSTGESVTVFGFFDPRVAWQLSSRSNGQLLTSEAVRELVLTGNKESQLLKGFSTSDLINGGDGNDTVYGRGGNDSIVGGNGNDWLNGEQGSDALSGGAGADTLIGDSPGDHLLGGAGDDVYIIGSRSIVEESSNGGLDEVRLQFNIGSQGYILPENVENGRLESEGVLAGNSGRNLLVGGVGNDQLYGRSGADRLTGGGGNDLLQGDGGTDRLAGGNGSDTYVYEAGDGIDFINNFTTLSTDKDTLLLKEVSESQLWLTRQGLDLEIGVVGQIDTVVVSNWYLDPRYQLDAIKVADTGKVLTADRVQGLVNAMAAFAPPPLGQAALPASTQAGLAPVMAASWQAA